MLSLIEQELIAKRGWIEHKEFLDLLTLAQSVPGPIAINSATFVGMRIAGISGALVATAGCVLPSCVIALILAWFYYRYRSLSVIQGVLGGVRPAVVAMIASAGLSILLLALFGSEVISLPLLDLRALGIFALALAALRIFKPDPIWVMAGAGVLGGILYSL